LGLVFSLAVLAKAKLFGESADLRETMKKAGVIGVPEMHFLCT